EPGRDEHRVQVERPLAEVVGVVVGGDRVQVDDAEEAVALLLRRRVLAEAADQVAEGLLPGGLDTREDPHGGSFPEEGNPRSGDSPYTDRMAVTERGWAPDSWRALPVGQQPDWPDQTALAAVRDRLRELPPLVFAGEARNLLASLGDVAEGRAFLLQAGDC